MKRVGVKVSMDKNSKWLKYRIWKLKNVQIYANLSYESRTIVVNKNCEHKIVDVNFYRRKNMRMDKSASSAKYWIKKF